MLCWYALLFSTMFGVCLALYIYVVSVVVTYLSLVVMCYVAVLIVVCTTGSGTIYMCIYHVCVVHNNFI